MPESLEINTEISYFYLNFNEFIGLESLIKQSVNKSKFWLIENDLRKI